MGVSECDGAIGEVSQTAWGSAPVLVCADGYTPGRGQGVAGRQEAGEGLR